VSRLDEIKARLAAATPAPWVPSKNYGGVVNPELETECGCDHGPDKPMGERTCTEVYGGRLVCESCLRPDAELIAHAPADIATLLRVAEAAEALLTYLWTHEDEEYAPPQLWQALAEALEALA